MGVIISCRCQRCFVRLTEQFVAWAQAHEDRAQSDVESLAEEGRPISAHKHFLVLEPERPICKLFTNLLKRDGKVTAVTTAPKALALISKHHYDVVLADTDLLGISWLELYQAAVARDRGLARRFLFFTSQMTAELRRFSMREHVPVLLKPMTIRQVKQAVQSVLSA